MKKAVHWLKSKTAHLVERHTMTRAVGYDAVWDSYHHYAKSKMMMPDRPERIYEAYDLKKRERKP